MKICKFCIMDSSCAGIFFNSAGRCNYCIDFEKKLTIKKKNLNNLINEIKKFRLKNKNEYDCVIGLSGGIDSSYTLLKAVECGLKPLAVHLDNGWNSELAQSNIEKLIKGLNVDFYTHVIKWNEFRNLMQSFFDSDVIDIEILTDNAMLALNYKMAKRIKSPFILAGTNSSTEGMNMPKNMNWFKFDKKNILAINSKFKKEKIITFPIIGIFDLIKYILIEKIKWISFLDYFDYNKTQAEDELNDKFGYERYKYKHYESVFTRFYQGFLLPKKFNVDKRKLHLSTLVVSKQINREKALSEIAMSPYPSKELLNEDKEYFIKKMKWTLEDLDIYLKRGIKKHDDYPNNFWLYKILIKIYKIIK